jgi:hypothetical protein
MIFKKKINGLFATALSEAATKSIESFPRVAALLHNLH